MRHGCTADMLKRESESRMTGQVLHKHCPRAVKILKWDIL